MDEPMTTDRFTELLSPYLDRELDEAAVREVEEHVAACPACADTLEELRAVKDRARTLVDAPPGADLWPGIAARIGGDRGGSLAIRPLPRVGARPHAGRRLALSVPQLAAAAVVVALVSAGAVWLVLHRQGSSVVARADRSDSLAETPAGAGGNVAAGIPGSGDAAEDLNRLRRILAEGRDRLDPRTVRTLEENLRIIEIAIAQSRRALEADPGDPYVRGHLTETMKRKVELMHRAAVLASAR
jgi:anti-sigma factor RsiW